jgi:hypothetical protein
VEVRRILGRLGALVFGLVGVVLGLIVNFVFSTVKDTEKLLGNNTVSSHGFIGLGAMIVGFIGAVLAPAKPAAAALLLLIAGAGFFYPVHLYALIASPFLLIAALLAFVDRAPATAKK